MLNNKLYLKSYNYHNFEVVMSTNDTSGQHVCVSVDVRGVSIANINVVCCLHS